MNICVFDTETTSLEKPFCYNIGYNIYDTKKQKAIIQKDFVVEQIWHNLPLFHSAYYAEKRPIYIIKMRIRDAKMEKIGYITQKMIRDFKNYNVKSAFAYNSDFDGKVFNFNCDWFKIINPFENIPIFDIRGYAHQFIVNNPAFEIFCEDNQLFTDAKNYSTTAETIFKFITNDINFIEEHTALSDARIETIILQNCINGGADWNVEYNVKKSIVRNIPQPLKISIDKKIIYEGTFRKKFTRKNHYSFTT